MDSLISAEEFLKKAVDCGYDVARRDYEEVAAALARRQIALEKKVIEKAAAAVEKEEAEAVAAEANAERERNEAGIAEADANREEAEADEAEVVAVQEWQDVEKAKLQLEEAELALLQVRAWQHCGLN
eukprot:SAG31_NODE_1947_length_6840_cov_4.654206_5_plen_128_part_00